MLRIANQFINGYGVGPYTRLYEYVNIIIYEF